MKKLAPGIYGIPATPFEASGKVDYNQLEKETDFIVRAGAHGLAGPIIASSFMELSDIERMEFMRVVTQTVNGRIPVVLNASGVSAVPAVEFAVYAEKLGADAIIALPPYLRRIAGEEIYNYYAVLSKAVSIPIVIQNSVDMVGTPIPTNMLKRLLTDFDNISYVKEERLPASHAISSIIEDCAGLFDGIFGGFGGRELIGELHRGMYGTMVACDVVDIQVRIFELFKQGEIDEAVRLHHLLLPLINMKSLLGDSVVKEMLRRRGVLGEVVLRTNTASLMDAYDHRELDMYFEMLKPYFKA